MVPLQTRSSLDDEYSMCTILVQVRGADAVGPGLTSVCAGDYYSCALWGEGAAEAAGQVVCWGEISEIVPADPLPFTSIACGSYTVCMVGVPLVCGGRGKA